MKTKKTVFQKMMEAIYKESIIRKVVTRKSHLMFFNIYFADYVEYDDAPFQHEMFDISQRDDWNLFCLMAFRGSSKSTIMNTSYSLWSILGAPQNKYVLILCQTRAQAKQHMSAIRGALERNGLLKKDLGPFREDNSEWSSYSLVFPKYGARITVASSEQSIRGTRHNQHRPDLILIDDAEDISSVKTREGREKTYQWFKSEVLPAGSKKTKVVVIGNLLHEDCLIVRLCHEINDGITDGIWRTYPLLDENDNIAWKGKYPTLGDIEKEKKKIGNEVVWQREYLLKIIPDEDQVIRREWIQYYDKLPNRNATDYKYAWSGVDLAVSQKSIADYVAIVSGQIHGYQEDLRIHILPNPVNKRMPFPQQVECIKSLSTTLGGGPPSRVFIESFSYQEALPQQLQELGFPVEGVKLQGDKREKIALTGYLIQNGQILFPKHGCEELIQQLVGFGVEKHDDLADAFAILIHKTLEDNRPNPTTPEVYTF